MTARRVRRDEGAGTLIAIAVLAVVGVLALAAASLGGAAIALRRAQGAADLAALSAAYVARNDQVLAVPHGQPGSPCERAREVAKANRSRLTHCQVGPRGVVHLRVEVASTWGAVGAQARAGGAGAAPQAHISAVNPTFRQLVGHHKREDPMAARAEGSEPPPGGYDLTAARLRGAHRDQEAPRGLSPSATDLAARV